MDAISTPFSVLPTTANLSGSSGLDAKTMEAYEKTAKDFESVFMAQMIKPMFEGIQADPLFGGGPGENAMRDFMVQEYGRAMVVRDDYGLSSAIMNEMIRMQEAADQASVGA